MSDKQFLENDPQMHKKGAIEKLEHATRCLSGIDACARRVKKWLPDDLTPLIFGSALFSMFFGAGNVVYSLWLGYMTHTSSFYAALLGFCTTGVLIPFLTLIAMSFAGDKPKDFFNILPFEKLSSTLLTLLLLVWAPLGSIPRAIELAYTSLAYIWPARPWAVTHLAITLLMGALTSSPGKFINLLGKWLTPVLLLLITSLAFFSFKDLLVDTDLIAPNLVASSSLWQRGDDNFFFLIEGASLGYQTMDGIAALFFAAFFITLMKPRVDKKSYLSHISSNSNATGRAKAPILSKQLVWTFIFAILIELVVYSSLMLTASITKEKVLMDSPAQLLHQIAIHYLGVYGGALSSWIILLAVIPTAVTLISITEQFFMDLLIEQKNKSESAQVQVRHWRIFFKILILLLGFSMSLLRIEGLKNFTQPLLEIAYPLILVLGGANITIGVWRYCKAK